MKSVVRCWQPYTRRPVGDPCRLGGGSYPDEDVAPSLVRLRVASPWPWEGSIEMGRVDSLSWLLSAPAGSIEAGDELIFCLGYFWPSTGGDEMTVVNSSSGGGDGEDDGYEWRLVLV